MFLHQVENNYYTVQAFLAKDFLFLRSQCYYLSQGLIYPLTQPKVKLILPRLVKNYASSYQVPPLLTENSKSEIVLQEECMVHYLQLTHRLIDVIAYSFLCLRFQNYSKKD